MKSLADENRKVLYRKTKALKETYNFHAPKKQKLPRFSIHNYIDNGYMTSIDIINAVIEENHTKDLLPLDMIVPDLNSYY